MNEIAEIIKDVEHYIANVFNTVKPILAALGSAISYLIFPDKAYIPAAIAVIGAMILDIITKYYALKKPFGSVLKAIKAGKITSDLFFQGTKKKLISFLVLMILCGLSVRVVPIAGVAVFFGTVVYSFMFLRECQSCIENLISAGHDDLKWFLPFLTNKQKDILGEDLYESIKDKERNDNNNGKV